MICKIMNKNPTKAAMLIKKYNLYDNEEFEKERKEYFVRDAFRNKNNIQIQENILITKDAFGVT